MPATYLFDFDDTAAATIICDNSANIHICNDKSMFKLIVSADTLKVVAMIGGQVNLPAGIGTVTWSWKYDSDVVHTHRVEQVDSSTDLRLTFSASLLLVSTLTIRRLPVSTRNGRKTDYIGKEVMRD